MIGAFHYLAVIVLSPQSRSAFNPALRGTANSLWDALLARAVRWSPRPGPLLVVSPHPDDEVLGAGGLIRTWSEAGHDVVVLSVTDGEAAYPGWIDLGALRRRELDQALGTLCSHPVRTVRLALPDGGVARRPQELIDALVGLSWSEPTLVAPFEADGHPDHEAVASACLQIARDLALPIVRYFIWAWHQARPAAFQGARWAKFALTAETQAAKHEAIRCFASQLDPGDGREPIVPVHVLEYFEREYEAFLL
jgi:LmbE family N-acetylglucosaminyl deacetylase